MRAVHQSLFAQLGLAEAAVQGEPASAPSETEVWTIRQNDKPVDQFFGFEAPDTRDDLPILKPDNSPASVASSIQAFISDPNNLLAPLPRPVDAPASGEDAALQAGKTPDDSAMDAQNDFASAADASVVSAADRLDPYDLTAFYRPTPESHSAGVPQHSLSQLVNPADDEPAAMDEPEADTPGSTMQVGHGINLRGAVTGCCRIVVDGSIESAAVSDVGLLVVGSSGRVSGTVAVEQAEVSGRCEGEIWVLGTLVVREGGIVGGNVRYGELVVMPGARLYGTLTPLADIAF